MITRLNVASIYVLDKDEALDFYVTKLGLEKGNDVRQGDYRWLTVRVPGDETTGDLTGTARPAAARRSDRRSIRELISKGALGGLVFLTDDAHALASTLRERGVTDFNRSPPSTSMASTWAFATPSGTPSGSCSRARSPRRRAEPSDPSSRLTKPTHLLRWSSPHEGGHFRWSLTST